MQLLCCVHAVLQCAEVRFTCVACGLSHVCLRCADDHPRRVPHARGRSAAAERHQGARVSGSHARASAQEVRCPSTDSLRPLGALHLGLADSYRAHHLPCDARSCHELKLELVPLGRLANSMATDIHKLPFRGTVSNGEVKVEQTKMGHSPPIWFVFSGAPLAAQHSLNLCLAYHTWPSKGS